MIPIIIGNSCRPELVALTPLTTCRNSGRNTMPPNIARPTTSIIPPETTRNTGLRNRCGGRIGSAARRSWIAVSPSSTSPTAVRPTISAEPHG